MKKPDFFIVGAAKSGTTAMYEYLKQHPEIFMPEVKELRFFGSDLHYMFPPPKSLEEYLSYFAKATNEKRLGEASPSYLLSEIAAKEIKEFNPSAQIIIMLRNPVDVVYAAHSECLCNGSENIQSFKLALETGQEERKKRAFNPHRVFVDKDYYRELVKFSEQVKRYFDVFDRDNIHIIIFDDFRADTAAVYKKTLRFLGVDDSFKPEFKIINPNKMVRSKALRDFLQAPPPSVRKIGKHLFPKPLRRQIMRGLRHINIRYTPRPPMDPELRRQLQGEFKLEVEKLSELLGRDLTYWVKE